MEIAILILVITSLLILGATCFFSFQIWIQSKELKISISNMNDEIKKINSEVNSNLNSKIISIENTVKEEIEKIIKKIQELNNQNIKLENNIENTKNFLNEQQKSSEQKIADSFNKHGFSLEKIIIAQNVNLENVIKTQTESLSGSNKTLKHSIENQIKEIDNNLNNKLVNDINQLIEKTNKETKGIVNEVLSKFDKTAEVIELRQNTLLKAITEPLSLTPNNYD